jgi:hypothetical protein
MSADHLRLSVEVNHLIGPPTEAWLEEWCVLMSEMHLLLLRYLKKSTVSSKLLLVGVNCVYLIAMARVSSSDQLRSYDSLLLSGRDKYELFLGEEHVVIMMLHCKVL